VDASTARQTRGGAGDGETPGGREVKQVSNEWTSAVLDHAGVHGRQIEALGVPRPRRLPTDGHAELKSGGAFL
jgi:hypothetical protein